jgi:hypothetical protein
MPFKLGQKVTWTSHGRGIYTTKSGEIEAIVPTGVSPNAYFREKAGIGMLKINFDGYPRDHESYLVGVMRGKIENPEIVLYWPKVKQLKEDKQ